ncbi:MAG: hypothetical protein HPY64_00485 [Anaerolineae bacterium]|nr:hypothetical protein [Anaerolineae bacterium]
MIRRILLVGLLAMIALPAVSFAGVRAQEDTGPGIMSLRVEVLFPAVVRFFVSLEQGAAAPQTALLTLMQEGRTLFVDQVDLVVHSEETATTWRYDWPIPPEGAPKLFVPVSYRWTLADAAGVQQEAEGEFLFAPGSADFRHGGEPPLSFSVVDSSLNLRMARQAVLPAYALMSTQTALEPAFRWAVLPSGFAFCVSIIDANGNPASVVLAPAPKEEPAAYPCREEDAERLFAESGYQILRRRTVGLLPFENELVDAMFEAFYGQYWAERDVPSWFRAGLRQYLHVNPDPLAIRYLQVEGRADRLFNAAQMQSEPVEADRQLWEAQAYSLVLYLADRYGAEAPLTLARGVIEGGWAQGFSELVGGDLEALMAGWERWLYTDAAARAGGWTLYMPATATPTPTRTVTPVPLTAIPPASVTMLPTLATTLTPTGVMTHDVMPVLTTAPAVSTATNTPRPPGSLTQPSPVDSEPGGGICPAALPALLMPAAGLAAVQCRKKLP